MKLALPLALLIIAILPAEALADIQFRGKSGQGRLVTLRTADDGVPERVGVRWRAPCARPGFRFTSRTFFLPPFDSVTRDRLVDAGVNRMRLRDGLRAVINVRVAANRRSEARWRGIFRVRVRVLRRGRVVDRCYKRTAWRVARL
jgi:hypothetical protein